MSTYLDPELQFNVSSLLGYFSQQPQRLGQQYNLFASERIAEVVLELQSIDEEIKNTVMTSIASKLDDLEVKPAVSVTALRARGVILLRELSSLAEVPTAYNKYADRAILHYV
jgi:hypothetical protein